MTDRVFPASKPATAPVVNGASAGGAAAAPATVTGNGTANGVGNQKAQAYNTPANRPVYRSQPYSRHHHHRSRPSCRRVCCCCCFWSILILLILALMAAIAATALYVVYHPRPPSFSVPSVRIGRLNLTTAADSSVSHVSSLFNFTLVSENPNQHLTFSYDPFAVEIFAAKSGVAVGNGTVPAFFSGKGNKRSFRWVMAGSREGRDLYTEEARELRRDLRQERVGIRIEMRTKVKMEMGKMKSRGVEMKVSCDGFQGTIPGRGKSPTTASANSKCTVHLSFKIWKWSL